MKTWLTNCGQEYVKGYEGIPNHSNQFLRNIFSRCVDAILSVRTGRLSLEYLLVTITACWLQGNFFSNGPEISAATKPSGAAPRNVRLAFMASL